ncbi:MAG TPA: deoxyribonuclease I [Planctomycetota bacterium]|nr:deoxyribonuclease I [Planctomycetota bacterium]
MRRPHLVASAAALALLAVAVREAAAANAPLGTYLRVHSWNARHMGWSGQTNWSGYAAQVWNQFGSTSGSANGCDLIAFQEVMYDTAPPSICTALQSVSGFPWSHTTTVAIGRSSYKERYSIVYRTDRVTLLNTYVWNDVGDKFEREPQVATFRVNATGADVTFVNWHTIFGTTAERQQEIHDIADVFKGVQNASASDQDVVLLGDNNASATSSWWSNLTSTAVVSPQVSFAVNDLTTLNSSCAYASAYDHFWMQLAYVTEYSSSGRDYVADTCALYGISDHAPIWLKLFSSGDDD